MHILPVRRSRLKAPGETQRAFTQPVLSFPVGVARGQAMFGVPVGSQDVLAVVQPPSMYSTELLVELAVWKT
jgi:hypothetical protein